jgi:hypothetical protein
MNKFAIGCVGLLGVSVVGAAGASYYAYHKVTTAVESFSELGSLGELDRSIRKQGPYTPPASGEPNRRQIERLVEIQRAVRSRLGTRVDELDRRYRRYFEPVDGVTVPVGGVMDSVMLTLRMYRDIAGIYVEGKRAQVEALNRAGVSLEEYRWTRSRAYAALGVPLLEIDIAGVLTDVTQGREPATPARPMTEVPTSSPAARRLVEPHRKALEDNVGLAFFGL